MTASDPRRQAWKAYVAEQLGEAEPAPKCRHCGARQVDKRGRWVCPNVPRVHGPKGGGMGGRRRSVWTVSGGAFESKRRKH
jgi:hypothetical protein